MILPLSCTWLTEMKGKRLKRVERTLLPSDYDYHSAEDRDQLSDGSLDLFFQDGLHVSFWSFGEQMSVGVVPHPRPVPDWVLRDVSNNAFWRGLIGHAVVGVSVLKSPVFATDGITEVFPSEFGVLVDMANGAQFLVEYAMNAELPDSLRIMPNLDHIPAGTYSLIPVCCPQKPNSDRLHR